MARCNGYRCKKADRAEFKRLREKLGTLRSRDWALAGRVMMNIAALVGKERGPSNGFINPRACSYCDYYGHTRNHCKVRIAAEEAAIDRMLAEDEQRMRTAKKVTVQAPRPHPQAETFDEMHMPYSVDPDLGPMVGVPGEKHYGMWTFENGKVVKNSEGKVLMI